MRFLRLVKYSTKSFLNSFLGSNHHCGLKRWPEGRLLSSFGLEVFFNDIKKNLAPNKMFRKSCSVDIPNFSRDTLQHSSVSHNMWSLDIFRDLFFTRSDIFQRNFDNSSWYLSNFREMFQKYHLGSYDNTGVSEITRCCESSPKTSLRIRC